MKGCDCFPNNILDNFRYGVIAFKNSNANEGISDISGVSANVLWAQILLQGTELILHPQLNNSILS